MTRRAALRSITPSRRLAVPLGFALIVAAPAIAHAAEGDRPGETGQVTQQAGNPVVAPTSPTDAPATDTPTPPPATQTAPADSTPTPVPSEATPSDAPATGAPAPTGSPTVLPQAPEDRHTPAPPEAGSPTGEHATTPPVTEVPQYGGQTTTSAPPEPGDEQTPQADTPPAQAPQGDREGGDSGQHKHRKHHEEQTHRDDDNAADEQAPAHQPQASPAHGDDQPQAPAEATGGAAPEAQVTDGAHPHSDAENNETTGSAESPQPAPTTSSPARESDPGTSQPGPRHDQTPTGRTDSGEDHQDPTTGSAGSAPTPSEHPAEARSDEGDTHVVTPAGPGEGDAQAPDRPDAHVQDSADEHTTGPTQTPAPRVTLTAPPAPRSTTPPRAVDEAQTTVVLPESVETPVKVTIKDTQGNSRETTLRPSAPPATKGATPTGTTTPPAKDGIDITVTLPEAPSSTGPASKPTTSTPSTAAPTAPTGSATTTKAPGSSGPTGSTTPAPTTTSTPSSPTPTATPTLTPPPVQTNREPDENSTATATGTAVAPVASRPAPTDARGQAPITFTPTAPLPKRWASGIVAPTGNFAFVNNVAKARGQAPATIEMSLPGRSWEEISQKNPLFAQARASKAAFTWSVPLTTSGASLAETASGRYDDNWDQFATVLAASPTPTTVRLTLPADADPATAKAAFRRVAQILTDRSSHVRIAWVAPLGMTPEQAQAAYPGSDVVTYIGLTAPSSGEWQTVAAGPGGLYDWSDFARRQHKQIDLQWSIAKNTNAPWVRNLASWVELNATQKRLGAENVMITGDSNRDAVTMYNSLW